MLMLLSSAFAAVSAQAEVGRDRSTPNCDKVLQQVTESLKRTRPAGVPGNGQAAEPAAAPAAGTAQ